MRKQAERTKWGLGVRIEGDRAEGMSAEALPGDGSGSGAGATERGELGCKPRRTWRLWQRPWPEGQVLATWTERAGGKHGGGRFP